MKIPITFIGNDGRPTADKVRGHPCVRVALQPYGDGKLPETFVATQGWALIDTSADYVYADPLIVQQLNAPIWGDTDVNGDPVRSQIYRCFAVFLPMMVAVQVPVVSRPFLSSSKAYPIVVGRLALAHFELTFNAGDGASHLTYIDRKVASL